MIVTVIERKPLISVCSMSWNMKHDRVLLLMSEVTLRVFVFRNKSRVSTFVVKQYSMLSLIRHSTSGMRLSLQLRKFCLTGDVNHRFSLRRRCFFTYPHMSRFMCIRCGLLGSKIIGPFLPGHQLGSLEFRACRPLLLKWELDCVLLEHNCSLYCF